MRSFIYFSTFLFLLFACSKENGKDWIVADIYVVDAVTGEPISTNLALRYTQGGMGQANEEIYSIGASDAQGFKHIEHDVLGGQLNFVVKVMYGGGYYGALSSLGQFKNVPISIKGNNIKTVELQPKYPVLLNVKNTNCTAPDDTLWLSLNGTTYSRIFVGCVDSLVSSSYAFTDYLDVPEVTYNFTTKKSGVINTYSESFSNLLPAEITSIQLDY
jgi:hypothetical protein